MRPLAWLILLLALLAPASEGAAATRKAPRSVRRTRAAKPTRPVRRSEKQVAASLAASRDIGTIRHLVAGDKGKFSLRDGKTVIGGLGYSRTGDVVSLEHTVVEPPFRGRGIAKRLVAHAVDWARQSGVKLRPACSFAVAEFAKHPEYADVLAP
jgi:predicted GNAT family acetyltransferase